MPIRGVDQVRQNLKRVFDDIKGPMTEKTITEILIIGGGLADVLTPQDLGNLVRSRFRLVHPTKDGWHGRYGYMASYAAAVHSFSGKLKGQPRSRAADAGNYWDPEGEPQWLEKGFEQSLGDIKAAIVRNMKL